MTDQVLPGMPDRLYAASPARLGTWQDCPRRYRFAYLDRPQPQKGPPWAHHSIGLAIHAALAGWFRLPQARRSVEAAGACLDQAWTGLGFRDNEQEADWRRTSREQVRRYVAGLNPDLEPRGVERGVAVRRLATAFHGRVDRIDERGDGHGGRELVVVDYKTGRARWLV